MRRRGNETMWNKIRNNGLASRFNKNEDGNMSLTFALSMVMVVVAVGAATDFSALSAAHSKSQSIADSTALTAAIFVKNNDRVPGAEDNAIQPGAHTAASLGHNFKNTVKGGADNVNIDVQYDDNAKEVTVTVSGETRTNFTSIFGKDQLAFSAESVVSYIDTQNSFPASIALVLDNSGSMGWNDILSQDDAETFFIEFPQGAAPRINGLQTSVNTFTSELSSRLGEEEEGRRTIRMGLLPYNDEIIAAGERPFDWGYISQRDINNMTPSGATNSNPPMSRAEGWLLNEQAFHASEARSHNVTEQEALKFVVFMTDGQNTAGNPIIIPGDTGEWFRIDPDGEIWTATFNFNGSTEGTLTIDSDIETTAACNRMKEDNVIIYTIGYSLEPGRYNANRPRNNGSSRYGRVTTGASVTAFSLLGSCATSSDHFIRAADGSELEAAFDAIQNSIVEELIRIKS